MLAPGLQLIQHGQVKAAAAWFRAALRDDAGVGIQADAGRRILAQQSPSAQ